MKWFMIKSILLASGMFICVLIGMQLANGGMTRLKGYDDPDFKKAMAIHENESGTIYASLLGNEVTSHDLDAKKEKLEKLRSYNFFSSMGKEISETLAEAAQDLINFVTNSKEND